MSIKFRCTVPILRMFDVRKAKEFYVGFLGFKIDFEHRFEPGTPLYMGLSRGDLYLHLSEHYGDGNPGAVVYVDMTGIDDFHREITAKKYKYLRPGIETMPWNARMMQVIDPFGNRIRFSENIPSSAKKKARKSKSPLKARSYD